MGSGDGRERLMDVEMERNARTGEELGGGG